MTYRNIRVLLTVALVLAVVLVGRGQGRGHVEGTGSGRGQGQERRVRAVSKPIPGEYIVVLEEDQDSGALSRETEALFSGRVKHVYKGAIKGFSVRLSSQAAARLAEDPRVQFVEQNGQLTLAQSAGTWGLDRIDQRTLPLDGIFSAGATGAGVTVHVIDTGIRPTHQEFGGRATIGGDYVTPGNGGLDCHGHGTHVAGTIGGTTYGVAKNATVVAHRVLNCTGNGMLDDVIAAIDAVTDDPRRPAVANMSLGGGASDALDAAVRQSVAAGVTYVVAAGNSSTDAAFQSPARVTEAITVGATGETDARASFSNYGIVLDLFAPGVGVKSAWHTSNTAAYWLSGTSMAAPHVAGNAALYLELHPTALPFEVRNGMVGAATPDVVINPGAGSPNRLLHTGLLHWTPPDVAVQHPNGGEKLWSATPVTIAWTASDGDGLDGFEVQFSADMGLTYSAVPGCSGLTATARTCTWAQPGPASSKSRIRVVARDVNGAVASDASDKNFTVAAGAGTLTVKAPNKVVNWGVGSTQQITWSHNLGANSYVRVELSRDGGASFGEVLALSVKSATSTAGSFSWTVTGPNVANARIRVSWVGGPLSDVGDTSFVIADPFVALLAPKAAATNWGYGSTQKVSWQTNLGPSDLVTLLLSTNGGATFDRQLQAGVAATAPWIEITTPHLDTQTVAARTRVVWTNAPAGAAAAAVNPVNFTIAPPFLVVSKPNGGEVFAPGSSTTVSLKSNLGALESVAIHLSTDGGSSYPIVVLTSTPADAGQTITFANEWTTTRARIKVVWLRNPEIHDASNSAFLIQ